MNPAPTTESAALTTTGIAGALSGAGVVTLALFPLAIPILLLTAVFTAPLVLPVLAVALVAVPVLLIRGLWRRATGGRRMRWAEQERGRVAPATGRLEISARPSSGVKWSRRI